MENAWRNRAGIAVLSAGGDSRRLGIVDIPGCAGSDMAFLAALDMAPIRFCIGFAPVECRVRETGHALSEADEMMPPVSGRCGVFLSCLEFFRPLAAFFFQPVAEADQCRAA